MIFFLFLLGFLLLDKFYVDEVFFVILFFNDWGFKIGDIKKFYNIIKKFLIYLW